MLDQSEPPAEVLLQVLPALQEAVVVQAADGRLIWANQKAATILDSALHELCGRPFALQAFRRDGEMYAPSELPNALALSTGTTQSDVVLGVAAHEGGTRWLNVTAVPSPDRSQVVTTLLDVTTAVLREEQAARARILQQMAVDNAGSAVVVTDAMGTIKVFNAAAEKMLGYRAEEVVDRATPVFFHDSGEITARAAELGIEPRFDVLAARSRAGAAETREWTYVRKDGSRLPVSLTVKAVRDGHGHIFGFMGIAQDMSLGPSAEPRTLSELAQPGRMRGLIDALPDLVFCIDDAGVFRYVHTPDPRLLYVPREVIIGRHFAELVPPSLVQQTERRVAALRSGDRASPFVYELSTPLGERSFEARVVRISEDEVAVIARDITESRALEKMKDEFVSTVSHELRTPLTSIRGALALVSNGVVEVGSTEGAELLATALRNAERLGRLINDILDLERAHANLVLRMNAQKLAPIVRRAVTDMRPLAEQFRARVALEECDEDATSYVDADRLLQVLHNLLSNAAKYGEPGGPIEISMTGASRSWRIQVSNKGPGIPDSFRSKLFQRFAVVDGSDRREREGTGLGLAISRTLVERMGGTIDYTSSSDRTTFFVDLPQWVGSRSEPLGQ